MLVGEQPGDVEDRTGRPFVGPAGNLLDRALAEAGIDREKTYVANAVKHFKWEARGKRRIHKPPSQYEIGTCKPWLQAELLTVRPRLVFAMGATAARSLLDSPIKITEVRGTILRGSNDIPVALTVHPSSILRSRDDESRHAALAKFIEDLRVGVSQVLGSEAKSA
jgi:DNA polymerase